MFIKVVPNTKGVHDTCFCYLVESYRENGKIKHRTLKNFGLLEAPYGNVSKSVCIQDTRIDVGCKALEDLTEILSSDEVIRAAKTTKGGFTQVRKISLLDTLLFYIFRSAETTNKDITAYFSKAEKPKGIKTGYV